MSRHPEFSLRNLFSVSKRPLFVTAVALLLVGSTGQQAGADEIYFTSGYSETGVVVSETETAVRFKTKMGLVTVSRQKVSFVEKASDEENQAMLKKWRQKALLQEEQLEAKREAERRFEIEQSKKGLVKFEDEWMSPERRQEILRQRKLARAHRKQFENRQIESGLVKFQHIWVTPAVERQLLEIEEEIESLVEQIEDDREKVEAYRNAMLNVGSLVEAEEFGKKAEVLNDTISKKEKELELLFKRADKIETASVQYKTPERFLEFLPPDEVLE
jgi:hypothetical protein